MLCKMPACGAEVFPGNGHGSPQTYCSPECRRRHYEETHPRVTLADGANRADRPTRAQLILGRLQSGRATGFQLLQAGGGMRYGARIAELRERGHRILGPKPWRRLDGGVETETVQPTEDGWDQYELRVD